ncbi:hypothetical protein BYT27DRAFT_7187273 [Phlegmacium glaucopus]|nr:hypothetical protein BYT27DRAFT_7187273 [Phlegmacium glaucopus]
MDRVNSRSPSSSPHIIVIAFHTRRLVDGLAPFRQRTSTATEKSYYLILTFVQLYVTTVITSCSSTGTNVITSYTRRLAQRHRDDKTYAPVPGFLTL